MSPHDTLQQIQARLAEVPPTQVIDELSPRNRIDAETWIRRLPIWIEHAEQFSTQAVAIARVIGQRAMRAFSLQLSEDGRVVNCQRQRPCWETPKPTMKFLLSFDGEEVRVEYTPYYFPDGRTDLVYFVSPHEPPRAHCLSETGHLSRLTPHDAVEAMGGPQAYAKLYAEAHLRGEAKEFEAIFEGKQPEGKRPRSKKSINSPKETPPVVGKHTAEVVMEQMGENVAEQPLTQRSLFDGVP